MKRSLRSLPLAILCSAPLAHGLQGEVEGCPLGIRIPIPVLGVDSYLGQPGGLYPDGFNEPPEDHRQAILDNALAIEPLNAAGEFSPDGWIGFVSIGFSNPTHEFGAFVHQENANAARNARVVLANLGRGGVGVVDATDPDPATGQNQYWNGVLERLAIAGLTQEQVQVVWLKSTYEGPTGCFLEAAGAFQDAMVELVHAVRFHFPNIKLCYLSSRIYAGYADPALNDSPEPYAYEEGFAIKWLIQDQIEGVPELEYSDPGDPAPLLLWGPYLWANGTEFPYEDLVWVPADFEQGGADPHPSPQGEQKVADALSDFLANDESALEWWPAEPGLALQTLNPTDDTYARQGDVDTHGTEPVLRVDALRTSLLRFELPDTGTSIVRANLGLRIAPNLRGDNVDVYLVPDDMWSEVTLSACTMPVALTPQAQIPLQFTRSGYVSLDLTNLVLAEQQGDGVLSLRLVGLQGTAAEVGYQSKESGIGGSFEFPPQLVLAVDAP
ncbi:MAG: hypothetical protein AAF682_13290 [Planctomycetota bacterium]